MTKGTIIFIVLLGIAVIMALTVASKKYKEARRNAQQRLHAERLANLLGHHGWCVTRDYADNGLLEGFVALKGETREDYNLEQLASVASPGRSMSDCMAAAFWCGIATEREKLLAKDRERAQTEKSRASNQAQLLATLSPTDVEAYNRVRDALNKVTA